jgi:hypothetical protein
LIGIPQVESKIAEHHTKLDIATATSSTRPLSPKRKEEPEASADKRKGLQARALNKKEEKTPVKKAGGVVRASQKEIKVKPKELKYKEDSDEEINWSDSDEDSAYPTIEKKPAPKSAWALPLLGDLSEPWPKDRRCDRYGLCADDFRPQERCGWIAILVVQERQRKGRGRGELVFGR